MVTLTHTWLDPARVTAWLRADAAVDPAEVEQVCVATEAYVQRCRPEFYVDPGTEGDTPVYEPDGEVLQGATMYAARELRRRNSPGGIELFADGGATFVAKFDADIERFLRTGAWNRPGVG